MNEEYEKIINYRDLMRNQIYKYPNSRKQNPSMVSTKMPFKIKRIIDNAKNKFSLKDLKSDLNPIYVIERIDTLIKDTIIYGQNISIKEKINDVIKLF